VGHLPMSVSATVEEIGDAKAASAGTRALPEVDHGGAVGSAGGGVRLTCTAASPRGRVSVTFRGAATQVALATCATPMGSYVVGLGGPSS
jgi:hypothetical protein